MNVIKKNYAAPTSLVGDYTSGTLLGPFLVINPHRRIRVPQQQKKKTGMNGPIIRY